jgi:hypothetical protein
LAIFAGMKFPRFPYFLVKVPSLGRRFGGMALFPFILVAAQRPSARLLNHEAIHLRQQVELLLFGFYIWYVVEFLLRWGWYRSWNRAYRNICFEREAYAHDDELTYLRRRKFWSFWKYL